MLRFIIFAAAALPLSCFANDPKEEKPCPGGKKHYRATIRHIESGGIGYEDGYTSLETFLSQDPSLWRVTPFLDARAHVFNSGRWAANAGIGIRTLWGKRVYGINTYYDYRNASHLKNANQIGVGFETLGKLFDFRINGYLPVGAKISDPYDTTFGTFSGHYLLISQKYQSAMKGSDAEFGFHFGKSKLFDFYAAAGPYYFKGKKTPSTWGGKARILASFKDIVTLEISDSYDGTFHNKFQGQVSLTYSFGPKSKIKRKGGSCKEANTLNDRMLQPVGRQEIIVIDNVKKNNVAIDPATGLPYFFVFVDNTSSSEGTYESPYPTLAQAETHSSPHDIIYVFPGDGTTTGMNSGIFLKANQKFWGSGINHSILTSEGTISIPAQSSSSPTITNTNFDTEGNAITLASNNAISGFTITSAINDAIYGTDAHNLEVSSCVFQNTTTYPIEAVFSGDVSISVTDNQFLNNVNGVFLSLGGTSSVVCANNTFQGQTSVSNTPIEVSASNNTFSLQIKDNTFHENITGSIRLGLDTITSANVNLLNNTITNNGTGSQSSLGSSFVLISNGTNGPCLITVKNNTFSENQSNSIYLHTSGTLSTLALTASSNQMSQNGGSALVLATPVDNLTLLATDNTISECNDNGIAVISAGSTLAGNITIKNNTISDIGNGSNAIAINQGFTTLILNISDNEIDECEGTGILSYATAGIDSLTLTVLNNTISNCQNMSSNAASGLDIEQYTNLAGSIAGNTLSGNANPALAIGSTLMSPAVCLVLTGNNNSAEYVLSNPMGGVFNLSPCNVDSVNIGTINSVGTVNLVQSCPDGVLCPP